MYCGKYDVNNDGQVIILNPNFTPDEINQFSNIIASYKQYYEQKLNINYNQTPVFVNTTPTSLNDAFLFVSFPTIMDIGWGQNGMSSFFDQEQQKRYKQFYAHELGHYYFGTYKDFNSELGDMMAEGFTEYISLKLTEEIEGKVFYKTILQEKINRLENFNPTPFSKVKSISDIENRQTYVYDYAPVIFIAVEKEIGKKKMWEWITNLLKTKTELTNYDFLMTTLKNTIKDDKKAEFISIAYFTNENSTKNALKQLKNN